MLIGELNRIKLEENPYSIEFIPKVEAEVGWICGCGRLNSISVITCCRCGRDKADQFKIISKEYLEKSYNDYQIYQEKMESKAKHEKQREDEEREKQIKLEEAIKQGKRLKGYK